MADLPARDLGFQRLLALDRIQRIAAWASTLLFLCISLAAASGWDWLFAGGHWYTVSVHLTRVFVVLGVYGLSGSHVAKRCPCTTMNACVIPIAIITVSITLQNPEVESHYCAVLGQARQTMQLFFGWLEKAVSTAEFDAILVAASKAMNSTDISDGHLFPITCVAQELVHAPSVIDSRCDQHEGFAFNLIIGHAFLLSIAASSGLTCRCCMASWLLSQLSSILLLVAHHAPSLKFYCSGIAGTMLISFILCLSVSLWTEQRAKMRVLDCIGFPPRCTQSSMAWQALSSDYLECPMGPPRCLISSSTMECTADPGNDSMDPNFIGKYTERIISSGSSACSLEPGSDGHHPDCVGKTSDCLISSCSGACTAEPGSSGMKPDSARKCPEHPFSSGTAACAPEPCFDSKGPDCISKNSLIVSEDGTLRSVSNLQEGHKVLAVDADHGQLVSVKVQTIRESEYQARNLIKIQCSSGIEATCTPEHGVLMKDDCVGFKEVEAANLVIGAKALIFQASEETITAVTVETAFDGVVSLGLECKNAILFAANPLNNKAIAMRPNVLCDQVTTNCWGTPRNEEETDSTAPPGYFNRFSSK